MQAKLRKVSKSYEEEKAKRQTVKARVIAAEEAVSKLDTDEKTQTEMLDLQRGVEACQLAKAKIRV